jgi:hypothetical protein
VTYPPRWSRPELEHLEQLAGDVPFPTLLRSMHYKATAEGWPPRNNCNAVGIAEIRPGFE